jgi:hypothetical protein
MAAPPVTIASPVPVPVNIENPLPVPVAAVPHRWFRVTVDIRYPYTPPSPAILKFVLAREQQYPAVMTLKNTNIQGHTVPFTLPSGPVDIYLDGDASIAGTDQGGAQVLLSGFYL